ncbi:hypothetical protein M569_03847 [Genlisea aurea]|uniref:NAC domain-containing protein n=1 Tax=Genlisea aurea TaxID=192259 RepID=S8EEE4_9LAMI|nr:hypothetical protein M569_03847 [Genlisea aurea]
MKCGGGQQLNLPAGFRFHPTDDELVEHYLCRKCSGQQIDAPIIAEVDLYRFDPWELPGMSLYGEKEWYFFSPRDRKYPNGSRPNRAAGTGYWKATGADKPLGKPKTLGIKKALVFYAGKAPRGIKTNWIMHEYRLANVDRSAGKRTNLRLDDWVLCRIYNKKGTLERYYYNGVDQKEAHFSSDGEEQKPKMDSFQYSGVINPSPLIPTHQALAPSQGKGGDCFSSLPKLRADSSTSEHVPSPEMKEVQSEPKWSEFDGSLDYQLNYMEGFQDDIFGSQMPSYNDHQMNMFQDMFPYMQKPF